MNFFLFKSAWVLVPPHFFVHPAICLPRMPVINFMISAKHPHFKIKHYFDGVRTNGMLVKCDPWLSRVTETFCDSYLNPLKKKEGWFWVRIKLCVFGPFCYEYWCNPFFHSSHSCS